MKFCATHNHTIALGHLRIPDDSRMLIARQLQEGVAIEKIFDNIRVYLSETVEAGGRGALRDLLVLRGPGGVTP